MFCTTRPHLQQGPGECCRGWGKMVCTHIAAVVCVRMCAAHGGHVCTHSHHLCDSETVMELRTAL